MKNIYQLGSDASLTFNEIEAVNVNWNTLIDLLKLHNTHDIRSTYTSLCCRQFHNFFFFLSGLRFTLNAIACARRIYLIAQNRNLFLIIFSMPLNTH